MKSLSLQMAESASLKKSSEAMSKSNVNSENSTLTESNTSFQTMLNKQVQAKQVSVQQGQTPSPEISKVTTNEVAAKSGYAKTVVNEQKSTSKALNAKQSVEFANDKKVAINNVDILAVTTIMPQVTNKLDNNSLPVTKKDEDNKSEEVVAVEKTNIPIVAPIPMSVINVAPIVGPQSVSITSSAKDELTSINEPASQKERNMDLVLSNALSQGKNIAPLDAEGQNLQVSSNDNSPSNKTNWIDGMLPNAVKQTISDESVSAKLTLNAIKDGVNKDKDLGMKDLTVAASFQPAPRINVAEAIQQIGSSNTINAYPGKAGWDQAISQKVVWMLGVNEQSATLTLNPPDMGPLQVVIHVHNDRADTTFISDNADVRQALQDGMANLRDKMNESGIQLGQANVSSGGQMQQQFQQTTPKHNSVSPLNANVAITPSENKINSRTLTRLANGLVDTFA